MIMNGDHSEIGEELRLKRLKLEFYRFMLKKDSVGVKKYAFWVFLCVEGVTILKLANCLIADGYQGRFR